MKALLENPEFMRYFRSHTRRGRAATYYTLFLVACVICLAVNLLLYYKWQTYQSLPSCLRSVFFQIIGTNFVFLLTVGAHACGESVSSERQSNTLEFQRITGMSSYTLALGKILGVPFIHYLLAAVGMPATMLCVICGGVSFLGWVASYFLLAVSGLFFCSAAAMASAIRKGKTVQRTSPIVLLVILLPLGPAFGLTVFRGIGGLAGSDGGIWTCLLPFHSLWAVGQDTLDSYRVSLFGVRVNGIVATLTMNAFLFLMAWAGTARRLGSDSQSLWTKTQLLAGSSVVFLLLGGYLWNAWPASQNPWIPLAVCTIAAHVTLAITATVGSPGLYSFRLGLRGRTMVRPWRIPMLEERRMAFPLVITLAIAYSGAVLTIAAASEGAMTAVLSPLGLSVILIPLVLCGVLYTELAQLWKLAAPERGVKLHASILFVWAVVPAVAGALLRAWNYSATVGHIGELVQFLSPLGTCLQSMQEGGAEAVVGWPFWGANAVLAAGAGCVWVLLARYRLALARKFSKSSPPVPGRDPAVPNGERI